MHRILRLSLALLASFPVSLLAGETASAQYTVKQIVFKGDLPYTPAQLSVASGLKPGDRIGEKELTASAQKLMDTGAFDDLQAELSGPVRSVDVIFTGRAQPAAKLLPVVFANFVWFSPEEMEAELQKRVPLFHNPLPGSGNLQATVQAALQAMLMDKGVTATVETVQQQPTGELARTHIEYSITSPRIVLQSVELKGISASMAASMHQSLQALAGRPYRDVSGNSLNDRLLSPYRNAGYLDAHLLDVQRVPTVKADEVQVRVSGEVVPGDMYRLKAVLWPGSPVLSTADFAKSTELHTGDIASQRALDTSLRSLLAAYQHAGYMDASVDMHPELDRAAHTVTYAPTVAASEIYRVRTISALNLSARQQKEFDSAWRLKPGDVYDAAYVNGFLHNNTALLSLNGYAFSYKASADPQMHVVDITLTFAPIKSGN